MKIILDTNVFISVAKETERPRSYIIEKAIQSYLEDYADLQIALDRLHDRTDPVISGKELSSPSHFTQSKAGARTARGHANVRHLLKSKKGR